MTANVASHDYGTLYKTIDPYAEGARILDLGAGDGRCSRRYLERDAQVTAVDTKSAPMDLPSGITWVKSDVREFIKNIPDAPFDVIMCINMIQFLDAAFVCTAFADFLTRATRPGGVCAIRTFRDQPTPPFPGTFPSLWRSTDLQQMLPAFTPVALADYDRDGVDFKQKPRLFRIAEYIAVRR